MKVVEYLKARSTRNGDFVLTREEAEVFGIKYPLRPGWVRRLPSREITRDEAFLLLAKLKRRKNHSGPVMTAINTLSWYVGRGHTESHFEPAAY